MPILNPATRRTPTWVLADQRVLEPEVRVNWDVGRWPRRGATAAPASAARVAGCQYVVARKVKSKRLDSSREDVSEMDITERLSGRPRLRFAV